MNTKGNKLDEVSSRIIKAILAEPFINESENGNKSKPLLAVVITFWIQPKKNGKKYNFKHIAENKITSIEDAMEEISNYESSTKTQALMTIQTIHQKSAIMLAMEELRIEKNFDYGVVSYNYC